MEVSCIRQVALVQRLYDVQGGRVLLDGADVRQLQVRWLRSHIGVVSQEPVSAVLSSAAPCSWAAAGPSSAHRVTWL
jgi:ATP-binding cassette, subfamily B (MDR/TAP), member 1